jgi:hypothetical protein
MRPFTNYGLKPLAVTAFPHYTEIIGTSIRMY